MGFIKSLFTGKDTPKEEKKEATALVKGQISKAQYVAGEKSEGKKEPVKEIKKTATAIKTGKMTPKAYAKEETKEYKKPATKRVKK